MIWVVFGHQGWIGQQVVDILVKRQHTVYTPSIRADDDAAVEAYLGQIRPDHVISLIGRTHGSGFSTIDYLEQKGKLVENLRDNLYAPFVLARVCENMGIHFTYMGTGCIFTYGEEDPEYRFTEADDPNFFGSSYSTVKGFTDRMMRQMPSVLNIRIRMPITAEVHPRNFITKITNYAKICSIPNSMTVLPELLPIMIDIAEKRAVGTVNLTNPGVISHNEILSMYRDIVDPSFTWENFTQEEQRLVLLSERSNNHLDTMRLQQLAPNVKTIHDSIRDVLKQMKKTMHHHHHRVITHNEK
jgi:3,5-epimerase/4-reductase